MPENPPPENPSPPPAAPLHPQVGRGVPTAPHPTAPSRAACPGCGAELPDRDQLPSLLGHCPSCLLAQGAQPPSHDLKDRDFGEYKLVRQVGRGAMGVVYEAVQLQLQRPVALKMMLETSLAAPGMRRRFLIEAEAAAKLSHPHIVPIYDYGEWQGQPFLTMKLVNGESLKEKLARTFEREERRGEGPSRTGQTAPYLAGGAGGARCCPNRLKPELRTRNRVELRGLRRSFIGLDWGGAPQGK
jgi:hypothetical protein